MFELMGEVKSFPLGEEDITQIHEGMSSLRVSVGEHVSQPSEVFVVTGIRDGLLLTFIIFYMIEPKVHVVYRFGENPYEQDRKEDVLEGAFQFVEEMGGILQEVPWGGMSPEDRSQWIADMNLFPAGPAGEDDLLEDLEEIQLGDVIEVLGEEDLEETSDFEVEAVEEGPPEPAYSEGPSGESPEVKGLEEQAAEEDVVSEEGEDEDFDQLLKQAFLNPELVGKTVFKKTLDQEKETDGSPEPEDVQDSKGDPGSETEPAEQIQERESGVFVKEDAEVYVPEESAEGELEFPGESDQKTQEEGTATSAATEESGSIKVVRFLSRY